MRKTINVILLIAVVAWLWLGMEKNPADYLRGRKKEDEVDWERIVHFSSSEFDSPDLPDSGVLMDRKTVEALDMARALQGKPWHVNSGFRTQEYNSKLKGSSSNSEHMYGLAVDIHCDSLEDMKAKLIAAKAVGFKRFGQYLSEKGNYFIHLGMRETGATEWGRERGKFRKPYFKMSEL